VLVFHFSSSLIAHKVKANKKSSASKDTSQKSIVNEIENEIEKKIESDNDSGNGSSTSTSSNQNENDETQAKLNTRSKRLKYHMKEFLKNARNILYNPVYFFIVICTTCETFLIKGFSSYLTKYLEYQYRLSASTATMIAGGIGFISLIGGALLGAYLIKRLKWHIKECAKFVTAILFITGFMFLGLILHCKQETFIGSKHSYVMQNGCNCDENTFFPLCYKTAYLFQTPCHAGKA
jgi:hypothetical protein